MSNTQQHLAKSGASVLAWEVGLAMNTGERALRFKCYYATL